MIHQTLVRFVWARAWLSLFPADLNMQIAADEADKALDELRAKKTMSEGQYAAAVDRAKDIAQAIQLRLMAPWPE